MNKLRSFNTGFYFSSAVLIVWLLMVLSVPFLELHPNTVSLEKILNLPDADSFLGYDDLGRPLFDRLLAGAYTSFTVAFGVVLVSLFIGTAIGVLSGYAGGQWDHRIVRIIDIFMAFPGILLAIALSGPGIG